MKGWALLVSTLFCAAIIVSCATSGTRMTEPDLPGPDGAALWSYLNTGKTYKSWNNWPGTGGLYKGTEPHGSLLTTYVNHPAYASIMANTGFMPYGAIVVKENYMPDKTLAATTVMYKVSAYDPDAGDWYWAKYGPEGAVLAEGRVEGCIGCHSAAKANDYIFTAPIR